VLAADTPGGLLAAAMRADRSRPLVTFYDDATGERVELSVATTANWVAKTANLLRDGLDVEPGNRVALLLPAHWQSAVLLLSCWSVGALALPLGDAVTAAAGTDVVFAAGDLLADAGRVGARELVGLSLRPMGAPLLAVPPGALDYAAEVPGYGDFFSPYVPVRADQPAVELDGRAMSGAELVTAAQAVAAGASLSETDRVLSALPFDTLDGLLAGLLAPLAAGAGVVLCRHLDESTVQRRIAAERVTVLADVEGGLGAPGTPAADSPLRRVEH